MSCQSKSAESGFVEVRELDGVWWFISPEGADAEARKVCVKHKNNPKLLGYYFTDEAAWMGFFRGVKEENKW